MRAHSLQVRIYLREDGTAPFEQWLETLPDRKGAAAIRARLARVRLGNLGEFRAVSGGVAELKVRYGPGYRIYFGRAGKHMVLLLGGGAKKTQIGDIRNAKARWADFKRRAYAS
ncbi:MAG: type II toxin-antitoxin system RelE/ParE family toxin [Elusimicrobiota bacterium]